MKKLVSFLFFVLCLCSFGFAQQTNRNGRLERVSDSIFILENGKHFLVDRNVITVKLKKGVNRVGKEVTELRSNRLGYIDLSVPEGIDIEDYMTMLEKTGKFDVIEYNSVGKYCFTPNDTQRSDQWYLNSISANTAWDITTGNPNIIVFILDSGTDWGHPDLGNGADGYSNVNATLGWNYITGTNNVITTNGHGTRVAGIVGAKTNNSRGIAGVAGGRLSRGVTLVPYCVGVAAPNGAILDDAIIDAVDNGARVIQLSLEVSSTTAINDAISYAVQNEVVVVCASGNGYSTTVSYPASHQNVIAVGAINKSNQRADFSNYGTNLDVVAPGVDILSTTLSNDYNSQDGTSFAAPQVSGIAALILSVRPDLNAQQVRNAIEMNCQRLSAHPSTGNGPNGKPRDNQTGYGLVDAYAAVNSVAPRITGPTTICGTTVNVFPIHNLPANASISWSYDANKLNLTAGSGQASVSAISGAFSHSWISATVNGYSIQKNIIVNYPSDGLTQYEYNLPTLQYYNVYPLRDYPDVTGIQWYWGAQSPPNATLYTYNNYATVYFYSIGGYTLLAKVINNCGTSSTANFIYNFIVARGGSSTGNSSVYPNPVKDILYVDLDAFSGQSLQSQNKTPTYDVRLYDGQGNLLRQQKAKGGTVQFNVQSLPDGSYFLHIYDGVNSQPEMFQIVVEH